MGNVLERFTNAVKNYPDQAAVIHHASPKKTAHITFKELDAQSNAFAEYLISRKVRQGAYVGIYMHKTIQHIIAVLGILKSGAAYYTLNARLKLPQVRYIADTAKSPFIFIDNTTLLNFNTIELLQGLETQFVHYAHEHMSPAHEHIFSKSQESVKLCQFTESIPAEPHSHLPEIMGHNTGLVLFTSGSTGNPKGVMISHQDLLNRVLTEREDFQISSNDCLLSLLPFSFDVGCNQLFAALTAGACLVILNSWLPHDIASAVQQYTVTGISGVPAIWSSILEAEDENVNRALNTLRYITVSGGDMPVASLRRLTKIMPDAGIFKTYGQTETFRSAVLRPHEYGSKISSVGRPVKGTDVFILNKKGQKAAPNEAGEIIHRGDGMMQGYLNDASGTRKKIKPHPLLKRTAFDRQKVVFTGDIGTMDEDGYLYILGRQDKMIKTSGYRVYPKEITDQILSHVSVKDAVVFGVKDDKIGNAIVCEVQLKQGAVIAEHNLKQYLAQRLPSYMVPAKICIVDAFPRSATGKIKLAEIEARYNVQG